MLGLLMSEMVIEEVFVGPLDIYELAAYLTFWGMMAWIRRARPPIVIQENVCGAPWPTMVKAYEKEGYAATHLRVDTKNHYIPHTRTRVYLLAVDKRAASCKTGESGKRGAELAKWEAAINQLSRPSSSSIFRSFIANLPQRTKRHPCGLEHRQPICPCLTTPQHL